MFNCFSWSHQRRHGICKWHFPGFPHYGFLRHTNGLAEHYVGHYPCIPQQPQKIKGVGGDQGFWVWTLGWRLFEVFEPGNIRFAPASLWFLSSISLVWGCIGWTGLEPRCQVLAYARCCGSHQHHGCWTNQIDKSNYIANQIVKSNCIMCVTRLNGKKQSQNLGGSLLCVALVS